MENTVLNVKIFDETFDTPIKAVYQRNHLYSATFETEDREAITELVSALGNIKVISETQEAGDDYDDIITLFTADGREHTVHFELRHLLKDGVRYRVTGYDRLEAALSSISDDDDSE